MVAYKTLIIEDFEGFRQFILQTLQQRVEFQVIYQASDGLEGFQRAEELQPDLILLDIGLPGLNGIEAARRIRKLSPNSKILFLTQETSPEVVQAALSLGAQGYVLKSDAEGELLPAIDAVLHGKQFVSSRLRPHGSNEANDEHPAECLRSEGREPRLLQAEAVRVHVVASYRDDASFVDDFIRFVEAALKAGNPVVVIATESHRCGVFKGMQARGWDMVAAMQEGSYISLDSSDTLSAFMINDWPDATRFQRLADDLITKASKAGMGAHPKVAICGECAPILWAQGKAEAAIELERLWDDIVRRCRVDLLCGYLMSDSRGEENSPTFDGICAEHSAAYSL